MKKNQIIRIFRIYLYDQFESGRYTVCRYYSFTKEGYNILCHPFEYKRPDKMSRDRRSDSSEL